MIRIENIIRQVLHNCAVSDSHYAGLYSICGLALRLRDLYKWENGLAPWVEKEAHEVLNWIGAKEEEVRSANQSRHACLGSRTINSSQGHSVMTLCPSLVTMIWDSIRAPSPSSP